MLDHFPDDSKAPIRESRVYHWPRDGLFDVTWSEASPEIIWSGSADGSILIYDLNDGRDEPMQVIKAHDKEIYNIEWSQVRVDGPLVLTSSWDTTVKLWSGDDARHIATFAGHEAIVYAAAWSPLLRGTFASASADGTLNIWNTQVLGSKPVCVIKASPAELLSCDWCKYGEHLLATGSVDGLIRGWDIRSPAAPVFTLAGHERAVKKVRFSPFEGNVIGSVSYDFTTRIWDTALAPNSQALLTLQNHTEFAYGLDFNVHARGVLADCGWDQNVSISCASFDQTPRRR